MHRCDDTKRIVNLLSVVEHGKSVQHFIDVDPLTSTTTESISTALIDCLQRKGVELTPLVGMEFDGATPFSGKHTGVQARLKQHAPYAVFVHLCISLALDGIYSESHRPEALGLSKVLSKHSTLFIFLLDENLPQTAKFSKALQAVQLDLFAISSLVDSTLYLLDAAIEPSVNWIFMQ